MVNINELVEHLNQLLRPEDYQDYCPNGLQVAGVERVERLLTGVSANQALIEAAIQADADVLLVHHGFFWKGEDPCVTGIHYERLSRLIKQDINLIAYHLPLDGHDTLGNNVQIAQRLSIQVTSEFPVPNARGLGRLGVLEPPISGLEFSQLLASTLQRKPFYVPALGRGDSLIKSIAWSTGAAQDLIGAAARAGADAFLTGEVSERTVAYAKELGLHFYAAGHHATERYGVQALGEHLAEQFGLAHQFVDIDNPI